MSTKQFAVIACSLSCLTFIAATSTLAANLIQDGGFEQPVTSTFVDVAAPNATTIPGWNVTAGSVDVVNAAGNGFDVGPAFEGAQYLDLNGTAAGTLSQVVPLLSGITYSLQFAYANNYNPPSSLTANVTVTGVSSTLLSTSVTHGSSAAGNLNWTVFSQSFTADGTSATLTFTSQNSGDGGVFLDAVSIMQVPEPSTWALIGAGVAGLGVVTLRHRSRAQLAA